MSEVYLFALSNGQVVITDGVTGDALSTGEPLGAPVEQVKQIPSLGRAIVRLDYMAVDGDFRNVLCIDHQGRVVWRAELPAGGDSPDAYVDIRSVTAKTVEANSWSAYFVTLDASTGRVLIQTFTK